MLLSYLEYYLACNGRIFLELHAYIACEKGKFVLGLYLIKHVADVADFVLIS